ncbi:MAG: imidazolonepropionase [Prevotella sp.]|nr:imidazolonepropionase [Prevotella sp.]
MSLLIQNIGLLVVDRHGLPRLQGTEMSRLDVLRDAWLLIEDGRFAAFGEGAVPSDIAHSSFSDQGQSVALRSLIAHSAEGGAVLPSFCDSHTHLVYADSREGEFVDKIQGLSYEEIARRGGGILNSADRLHALSEDALYHASMHRIDEIIRKGTGAVEIKSGYGLNTADELKMLRVIRRIKETAPLRVVSTFLGAHAVGRQYSQPEYVDLVVNEMLPEVAREGLADYVDVFCDRGFFTPEETTRILEAGLKYGMRGKIHGEELAPSGGVEVAVKCGALSVDHLESMTDEDIQLLRGSDVMPTALPGTSFFLNMPFAPARKMIESGLGMAIASDYNPGSTPSGDMKFAVSLACIKMRLMPAEALNAATLNSAYAMGLSRDYGSIAVGKVANCYITDPIPSIDYIPYAYTQPIINKVILKGEVV